MVGIVGEALPGRGSVETSVAGATLTSGHGFLAGIAAPLGGRARGVVVSLSLVTCGGTIAMHRDRSGVRVIGSSEAVAELAASLYPDELRHVAVTERDSGRSTPAAWEEIARAVELASRTGPVVVTHGTDSLVWSAAATAVAVAPAFPVVFTGALVPLLEAGSDAEANLRCSLAFADALEPGVWVGFTRPGPDGAVEADAIQAGYARKIRASGRAFEDLNDTPHATWRAGRVTLGGPRRARPPWCPPPSGPSTRFRREVAVVRAWPGVTPTYPADAVDLVIETYPAGTVPAALLELARAHVERGGAVHVVPAAPLESDEYDAGARFAALGAAVHLDGTVELVTCALALGD
jgi:L-asparaginase/Glu-tRNA(Gln) amidotransferase subunit D